MTLRMAPDIREPATQEVQRTTAMKTSSRLHKVVLGLALLMVASLNALPALAQSKILDPIPDPIAVWWIKEGSETFSAGNPLTITDQATLPNSFSPQPFCDFFFVAADADFASEIKLTPIFIIDPGYVPDISGNTGIPYFRIYDLRSTYATRLSAGGVADEWVTQLLRQGDAKVFKKYSQMKLQMKREALEKMNRQANEMPLESGTATIQ